MKNKDRRRKGDRWAAMRGVPGANIPAPFPPRRGKKYADPEVVLQNETNEFLARAGQFHFRLSSHALAKAGDASLGGWPDNPMIVKLGPGLALLGPLELKKQGESLRPNQLDMQAQIGTVVAETFPEVEAYCTWFWRAAERLRKYLRENPLPTLEANHG